MSSNTAQVRWTDSQRRAIATVDRSVLVSAAAGSGKTAVLAEHCAYLLCDAPEAQRCNVDQLIVVTFTTAAADEMKSRIAKALRQRLTERDDSRLARQIMLLDTAQISTLHSFCTTVLRRHFNLVGLDPHFTLLDDEEARLLRIETCRQLIAERYETDKSDGFRQLIDLWVDGNDERILECVIRTHEMLCSVVDPQGWLDRAVGRLREASAGPLAQSALGRDLAALIDQRLSDYIARSTELSKRFARNPALIDYAEFTNELLATVHEMKQSFGGGHFDALVKKLEQLSGPALPRLSNSIPGKEQAKAELDVLRDELESGSLASLARFTEKDWRDGLAGLLPAAEVFVDLVRQCGEAYRQEKRQTRSLDFSDLERLTLEVLLHRESDGSLSPSGAARRHHRAIKRVLVDEYQDINEVQDTILRFVSRECLSALDGAVQNLFCVGDVKQSIYRFRLADPQRFLERNRRLRSASAQPTGTVIDLQENFRSRAPLLSAINHVFERLMTPEAAEIHYDESHRLREGAVFPVVENLACFFGAPIELHLLPDKIVSSDTDDSQEDAVDVELDRAQREAVFVGHRIQQLTGAIGGKRMHIFDRSADPAILRPIEFRDIAILLRATQYKARQFAEMLRPMGIRVHSDAGGGFFESIEVRDMLALLSLLDNFQQDIPLAAFLRGPIAGLDAPDDALARVRLNYPGSRSDPVPFHRAVARYSDEQNDALARHLRNILGQLDAWRDLSRRRPLAELLWTIFDQTGYLAFCSGLPDGQQRVANLIRLHERARQFGTFQRQGLRRFLQFLSTLQDEEQTVGQPPVATEADDAVRVMSIHRAKGLEFPVVIVADLGKQHNLSDTRSPILVDRQAGLGMMCVDESRRIKYPSAASVVIEDRIRRQSIAEELRVLYVAMTRAREHLVLVGTCSARKIEQWRERWTAHEGPIPTQDVARGRSMLDWIGPVAVATGHLGEDPLDLIVHDDAAIVSAAVQFPGRAELSESQQARARLAPLDPAPSSNADCDDVRRRLRFEYPHGLLTGLEAARSVGSMVTRPTGAGWTSKAAQDSGSIEELSLPRCAAAAQPASALERGSAIHRVLQHFDFAEMSSRDAIRVQVEELARRKLITDAEAQGLDGDAIWWLLNSSVGRLLRANAGALRRELPIHFPTYDAPQLADPLDQVMVRGRIDVLIPDQAGLVLVDYKTDRVTKEQISSRAELYRPQVEAYAHAIGQIVGEPVKGTYLVFLTAREIVSLSP